MHATTGKDKFNYFVACALLGKDPDSELTIEDLKQDIREALDCITNPVAISVAEWNEARDIANEDANRARNKGTYGKERHDYERYAKATADSVSPDGKPVETAEKLIALISEYSNGQNRVLWSSFEAWCVNERHLMLDKSTLSLPEGASYPQGLNSVYPGRFGLESTAFGEVLSIKNK